MVSSKFLISVLVLCTANAASLGNVHTTNELSPQPVDNEYFNTVIKRDLNDPNPVVNGAKSAMVNYEQTVQSLIELLRSGNKHPAANAIGAFITGIDSQIDNAGAVLAEVLEPVTLGASKAIGDALLGPFFQAATNGAEVVIANILGAPIDFLAAPILNTFSNSLEKLSSQGTKFHLNSVRLNHIKKQLQDHVVKVNAYDKTNSKPASDKSNSKSTTKKISSREAVNDCSEAELAGAQTIIDNLVKQVTSGDPNAAFNAINSLVTGINTEITNVGQTAANILSPLSLGASKSAGTVLLAPFFKSVTKGADVVVSKVVTSPPNYIATPVISKFNKHRPT